MEDTALGACFVLLLFLVNLACQRRDAYEDARDLARWHRRHR